MGPSTDFFGNYHVTVGHATLPDAGQHFCGTDPISLIAGIYSPVVSPCTIPPSLTSDFDRQLRWSTTAPMFPPDRGADQVCVPTAGNTAYTTTYPVPLVTTTPLPPIR